jgi:8-oxo-dGTP pyrophosphatase MutT (NUDIX family)
LNVCHDEKVPRLPAGEAAPLAMKAGRERRRRFTGAAGHFMSHLMIVTSKADGALRADDGLLPGLGHKEPVAGPRVQYAALPYRRLKNGGIEVMLITSRTTRRWIIPKGWPMGTRAPHKVAAREAFEEAGIEGRACRQALGAYHYDKLLANGTLARCRAEVFALKVEKQKAIWPERKQRERRWLSLEDAAALISDAELAPLIRGFVPVG